MATDDKNVDNNAGLKRILYLDKEYRDTILFDLDNNTTCETILNEHKNAIIEVINGTHKKSIDDCEFLIMENKINRKFDDIPTLMEFKLKMKTKLYNLLNNHQNNLFFLPKRKKNREERLKARNENNITENCFNLSDTNYFSDKNVEEYLSKSIFYLYDATKQVFNKEKGTVDRQKITIYKSNTNKELIEIIIKDIVKDLYYSETSQAPYKKNLPIKGDKPKFFIEIVTKTDTFYFGQFKENAHLQWEKAIKKAIDKYNNFNVELNLNININSSKTGLYAVHHSIMDNCFVINQILSNEEKRKMFLSVFSEKKICSIIMNILTYKSLIKMDEYLEAWMCFKEILTYIDSYNTKTQPPNQDQRMEKILQIFSKEKTDFYKKVSEASNENVKKINMVNASLSLFKTEMKRALHEILKEDLFEDVLNSLYKLYIVPYFNEVKNNLEKSSIPTEKPLIREKFQFLLAIYFNRIFSNSHDNFYDLFSTVSSSGFMKTETLSSELKFLLNKIKFNFKIINSIKILYILIKNNKYFYIFPLLIFNLKK